MRMTEISRKLIANLSCFLGGRYLLCWSTLLFDIKLEIFVAVNEIDVFLFSHLAAGCLSLLYGKHFLLLLLDLLLPLPRGLFYFDHHPAINWIPFVSISFGAFPIYPIRSKGCCVSI